MRATALTPTPTLTLTLTLALTPTPTPTLPTAGALSSVSELSDQRQLLAHYPTLRVLR